MSFEPNTKLAPCFSDIKGPLIQAALWTEDGEVTFFIDEKDFDGSSVFADQSGLVGGTKISVPAVKLSRWLMENVSPDDYCVLKLDIEASGSRSGSCFRSRVRACFRPRLAGASGPEPEV